jgi:hypothetical protein
MLALGLAWSEHFATATRRRPIMAGCLVAAPASGRLA